MMDVSFTKWGYSGTRPTFLLSSDGHWCIQTVNGHLGANKIGLYISRSRQVCQYGKLPSCNKTFRLYYMSMGWNRLFFYRERYILAQSGNMCFAFDFELSIAIDIWFINDYKNIIHFDGENLIIKQDGIFSSLLSLPIYTCSNRFFFVLAIAQGLFDSSGIFHDFLCKDLYDPRLLILIDQFDEKKLLNWSSVVKKSTFFNSEDIIKDKDGNLMLNGHPLY